MYTSILERAWGGIEKETRHVTVVCAHHDVPALAETLITPHHCGNHLHSDWQVHTTYYYRRIEGRELGRQETSRVVTLCAAGFAAAHDRRTFQLTNLLDVW